MPGLDEGVSPAFNGQLLPVRRRKRDNLAIAACEPCRRRKVKCGCERPACERCAHANRPCSYETQPGESQRQASKRKLNLYEENLSHYRDLFEQLKTLDSYRANDVYQRIRHGFDPDTLLAQIRGGDLISQLYVQPETRFRYDLPYIKHMPRELLTNNAYLNTLLYEPGSLGLDAHESQVSERTKAMPRVFYLRPFHAAQFIDSLIDDAKPSLWTTVCQDDGMMRRILRNHFLCEYYFISAIQKNYFLEDMVSEQGDFCSSLLVNAVMAYACVCDLDVPNRAEYWNPTSLTYKFLVEAKRLWELEGTTPSVSNVQAGMILNGICNICGLDEVGQIYRRQSIALANDLHLYDGPVRATSERSRQGKIYTAWALFCWDAKPPPPHDFLPPSAESPSWYGQFWLKYPGHDAPISVNFGAFFEHRAKFRIIMAQYCFATYREEQDPAALVSDAYFWRSQMLTWFAMLPTSLQPDNIVLPAQLQLHMYYHQLMTTIFEPLAGTATQQRPRPDAIMQEANTCFATLYRLYYIRHGYQYMDIHIIISLIFAGARCLDAIQQMPQASEMEGLYSTLTLCAIGLYYQRSNHHLAQALYAMLRAEMRPEEVLLLKQLPDLKHDEEALILRQATRSKWLPIVVKPKTGVSNGAAVQLVQP